MDILTKIEPDSQPVTVRVTATENNMPIFTTGILKDGKFIATNDDSGNVVFAGVSEGNAIIDRMMGIDYAELSELMTKAVNNRTRQRNYFRLYSQMLEGEISEDQFYKLIEENEDDFVVEEEEIPTKERLMHALRLSKGIKNVDSSEDLSNLFSFDSIETDKQLAEIEAHGSLQ